MKPSYSNLENDIEFKKYYYKKTLWWNSILMLPPVLFLFTGLIGILYLFNLGMLATFYIIPYLLLFFIGTLWLKAIRRHLQKVGMAKSGAFNICIAKIVGEKDGYVYTIFVNNHNRHQQHYISKLAETVSFDDLLTDYEKLARKKSVTLVDLHSQTQYYMRAYFNNDITKSNLDWQKDKQFPILFIDPKYTFVIKKKHLME